MGATPRSRWGSRVVAGLALLTSSALSVASPASADPPSQWIFGSLTYADPSNPGQPDWVWVNGLSADEAVHVDVDFEGDGVVDRSTDGRADGSGTFAYDIGTSGFVVPGSRIVASGSGWQKQLELVEVRVEYTDAASDVVAGVAPPGSTVHVSVSLPESGPPAITGDTTADADGWWRYDLSGSFDLMDDQIAGASVDDPDGDVSSHGATVRRPVVHATLDAGPSGYLWLWGWTDGTPVTVTVDYEPDGIIDETYLVAASMFGPGLTLPEGHGPLQVGSVVTATANFGVDPDRWVKMLTLEPVTIDGIDVETDVTWGTAPAGRTVSVEVFVLGGEGPAPATYTDVPVDADGWTADFAGVFDFRPGTGALVRLADDDGDTSGISRTAGSFGRLALFRWTPNDPNDPYSGGTKGDAITPSDEVAHGEWIWVEGSGLHPDQMYQLNECKFDRGCRNTWSSMPWAFTDGSGSFGQWLQVGRNVLGSWGQQPRLSVGPTWDVRDGQTLFVTATGMPGDQWDADCGPGECWIGVRQPWMDDGPIAQSDPLTFAGDRIPVVAYVAEALEQQMEAIVHFEPGIDAEREVLWNPDDGTLAYGYTAQRWLEPDTSWGPYSPPLIEAERYDCADNLAFDPETGAAEPVHCSLSLELVEQTPAGPMQAFLTWEALHFARFDLTGRVTSALLGSKPAGVTLLGEVTCTGFSPEQYLVNVEGSLSQTTARKRPVTTIGSFETTTTCSGTMANPGKAFWSVFVPGAFQTGGATVALDLSAAGFTRTDEPLHVESTVTITAPPKGRK